MATPANRSVVGPSYQDWDRRTRDLDLQRAASEVAAGRPVMISGNYATLGQHPQNGVFPDPVYRYGYPGQAKGAIYALDPDDHTRGDCLYFSRFPTELNERIEAVLAIDSAPGRAYPAIQQMGAKGVQLSVELWFCDAFMWSRRDEYGHGINSFHTDRTGPGPLDFTSSVESGRPVGTLADQARTFFEFYLAGHDGTGIALPPADVFLHWGGRPNPIPVVIKSVDMKMECFTTPDNGRPQMGGAPQIVTAKVEFEVNIPLRVVNPFKPRKPKPPKKTPPKVKICVTPGEIVDGSRILGVSAAAATFSREFQAHKDQREMTLRLSRLNAQAQP